jgi:hypothetical protein
MEIGLMRFVGALDSIFGLAVTRKLLCHFKNVTWRKTTGFKLTKSPTLNLWDDIGSSPVRADNR